MPEFAHLPLLLKPDGNGKLSKRDGDRLGFPVFPLEFHDQKSGAVYSGYRESGYFPEAVINFLALLGWHSGDDKEIYSMEELIQSFSLERVSKAGAKFDFEKGKWFNHQYLQMKDNDYLADIFCQLGIYSFNEKEREQLPHVIGLVKERVNFVRELWEQMSFFFVAPTEYDEKSLKKRWKEDSRVHLTGLCQLLRNTDDWSAESLDEIVMSWIAEKGYGVGIVMNAFRICLVGAARVTAHLGDYECVRQGGDPPTG